MRRALSRRRCPSRLAGVGVMLGFLAYLLPLYGVIPGRGPAGASDRTPGIVFARHRQAHPDVAADDRPVPRPFARALAPVSPSTVPSPEPAESSSAGTTPSAIASPQPSPGAPRSPPVL